VPTRRLRPPSGVARHRSFLSRASSPIRRNVLPASSERRSELPAPSARRSTAKRIFGSSSTWTTPFTAYPDRVGRPLAAAVQARQENGTRGLLPDRGRSEEEAQDVGSPRMGQERLEGRIELRISRRVHHSLADPPERVPGPAGHEQPPAAVVGRLEPAADDAGTHPGLHEGEHTGTGVSLPAPSDTVPARDDPAVDLGPEATADGRDPRPPARPGRHRSTPAIVLEEERGGRRPREEAPRTLRVRGEAPDEPAPQVAASPALRRRSLGRCVDGAEEDERDDEQELSHPLRIAPPPDRGTALAATSANGTG
jgi:hypothetical protein